MSNNIVPLEAVAVNEPRIEVSNKRQWVILKGGNVVTYQPYPTLGPSNAGFNFNIQPPSATTILDRNLILQVPVTITFTLNPLYNGGVAPATNLLQPGRDAFRAYPISSITETLRASINGYLCNIELADCIHAMSRFHTPLKALNNWLSKMPDFEDNCQQYSQMDGATNNPLSSYVDGSPMSALGRGSYPFTVVSNTPTSATITAVLTESIFLPPFLWESCNQAGGLSNLNTLTLDVIFGSYPERIWSHSDITNDASGNVTIGSMNVNFTSAVSSNGFTVSTPSIYAGWITPRLTQSIPRAIVYPYYDLVRFRQNFPTTIAPNGTGQIMSQVISLNSIPRKMYIFVKQSKQQVTLNTGNRITYPDVFTQITNLNVNWNNQQGIFSGASPQNLYDISASNGYNKTWAEWWGLTQRLTAIAGNTTQTVGLEGSIVCVDFAKDIGLRDNECEGMLGQYMLQVQLNITNINQNVTLYPELYIIVVNDGTLTITPSQCMGSIGVPSVEQVLNAPMAPFSFHDLHNVYGGGFFDSFKNFLGKAHSFIKDNQLVSKVLGALPYGPTQVASNIAKQLGYGEGVYAVNGSGARAGAMAGEGLYDGVMRPNRPEGEGLYGGAMMPPERLEIELKKAYGHKKHRKHHY